MLSGDVSHNLDDDFGDCPCAGIRKFVLFYNRGVCYKSDILYRRKQLVSCPPALGDNRSAHSHKRAVGTEEFHAYFQSSGDTLRHVNSIVEFE